MDVELALPKNTTRPNGLIDVHEAGHTLVSNRQQQVAPPVVGRVFPARSSCPELSPFSFHSGSWYLPSAIEANFSRYSIQASEATNGRLFGAAGFFPVRKSDRAQ